MKAKSKTTDKAGKAKTELSKVSIPRNRREQGDERILYLASLIDNISDALISTDMEFHILEWNAAAESMYGWSAAEVIGHPLREFVRNEYLDTTREEVVKTVLEQGIWRGELTQNRKDGTRIPVVASVSLVKNQIGKTVGFVAINRDITQRKRAEEALRESEAKFSAAFHSSPLALVITTFDGKFVEANRAFGDLVGYSQEEIIGITATDLGLLSPQDRERIVAALEIAGGSVSNFEVQFRVRDGGLHDILYSLETISFRGVLHRLSTGVDITAHVRAEKKIAQMNRLYATLSQVNQTIVRVKDRDNLYQSICDVAVQFGEFFLAWVGLLEAATGEVRPVAANGLEVTQWPFQIVNIKKGPLKNGLIATAIRTSRVVTSEDVEVDKRTRSLQKQFLKYGYHSTAAIPFGVRGETLGILCLVSREVGLFKAEQEVRLLEELSLDISFALDTMETEVERSRAEAALIESEEKFQMIFKAAPGSMILSSLPDGKTNEVNENFSLITGYSREEALGKTTGELMMWADIFARDRFLSILRSDGIVRDFEADLNHKSGTIRNGLVSGQILTIQGKKYLLGVFHDITERRQAEEKLQASERMLKLFVEYAPAAIAMFDGDMKYIAVSPRYLADYHLTDENIVGRSHYEIFPEIPDRWKEIHRRCLAGAIEKEQEDPFPRMDGTLDWVRWEIHPWYDKSGDVGGIILFSEVITERKRAKESLAQSEQAHRTLFENMPIGLYRTSAEGLILDANPALVKMFGFKDRESILAKNITEFYIDLANDEKFKNEMEKSNNLSNFVAEYHRLDGTTFWTEDHAHAVRNEKGSVLFYEGSLIDVTERKLAGDQLREAEERYRNLLEVAPVGIAVHSEGRILFTNPAGTRLLGGSSEEQIVGRSVLDIIHPTGLKAAQSRIQRMLAGEQGLYPVEDTYLKLDGTLVNVEVMATALNFNGKPSVQVIVTDVTERKLAEEKIRRQIDYLTALQDIDRTIASAFDMHLSLTALISKAVSLLAVDAAAVLLIDFTINTLEFVAGEGFRTNAVKKSNVKLGESYAGRAALERRIVKYPNPKNEKDGLFLTSFFTGEDFVSYYGVPLIVKDKVIGVLEVFHRSLIKRDQEWLDFLNALAGQAAVAISNAQLFDNLQQTNNDLMQAYDATIEGWSRAMDLRDKETEGHTLRVTEMALRLADLMGISDEDQIHIRRGALLHDIGKLGVPDAILLKPGKLTDEEWVIMRQHPTHAYEMLSSVEYLKPALDIPYCHHEKWDGSGYPRGLLGEQIPLTARIFAIVDVWDALRSDRPYRAGWTIQKTREYIREESGKHFEPRVVEAFLKLLGETTILQ